MIGPKRGTQHNSYESGLMGTQRSTLGSHNGVITALRAGNSPCTKAVAPFDVTTSSVDRLYAAPCVAPLASIGDREHSSISVWISCNESFVDDISPFTSLVYASLSSDSRCSPSRLIMSGRVERRRSS
jgi:hypothetical protein